MQVCPWRMELLRDLFEYYGSVQGLCTNTMRVIFGVKSVRFVAEVLFVKG